MRVSAIEQYGCLGLAPEKSERSAGKRDGTVSMVLGVIGASLGLILGWFAPFVPAILGIIGLTWTQKEAPGGKRTAGFFLGFITAALGSAATVLRGIELALTAAG